MMAFHTKAQRTEDPGIGTSFEKPLDRLVGKDGSFMVNRAGQGSSLREGFIALVTMPIGRLLITFIIGYLGMNLIFGSLYMLIGVENVGNDRVVHIGCIFHSLVVTTGTAGS